MDDVPEKRPQQPNVSESHPSPSITLPKRPRNDNPTQPTVTSNGGRELSASSAVNAREASFPTQDGEDEDDYTSSSGSSVSSSDDDDDDDDDDHSVNAENFHDVLNGDNEGITSLPARRKPHIRRLEPESSLLSKLSAFLPQMKTANEDLQKEIAAGRAKDIRLDDADENDDHGNGQYIEMNLGLGVLEEKREGDDSNSGEGEARDSGPHCPSEDTHLLDQLMGKGKTSSSEKPSIQDLGD